MSERYYITIAVLCAAVSVFAACHALWKRAKSPQLVRQMPEWRMPATERLIEILQTAQRDGENLLDTADRLVSEAQAYQAYARQSDEPEGDDSETTVFTRPSADLDKLIDKARDVVMTPEQTEAQRRSFAFGNASMSNPEITREMIDQAAETLSKPQPAPVSASGPALWPMIADELEQFASQEFDEHPVGARYANLYKLMATDARARHEFGMAKYGVPLVASNGRDHLVDAYQEALDCVVYMRAARESSGEVDGPLSDLYRTLLEDAVDVRGALLARDGK